MNPFFPLCTLFAVDVLAVVSPGPAFLAVSRMALCRGGRGGVAAAFGLTVAVWVWCLVVLCGLGVLFRLFPWFYGLLKVVCGCYLVCLGAKFWRASPSSPSALVAGGDDGAAQPASIADGFIKGMLIGLTNPKAMIYFGSIFTLFVKPGSPLWLQGGAVAIASLDTLIWYAVVAVVFSRPSARRVYARLGRGVERAAGVVMGAFGLRLILWA